MFDPNESGRRIRSWCVDSGISQDDLANEIGMNPSTLKSYLYGNRPIELRKAVEIADYFGKSLDELACRTDYTCKA